MNIESLRGKYQGYSDTEIVQALQRVQYPDYSIDEVANAVGYKPPTRNPAAVANDWVIEVANAFAGGSGAVADMVSPGNWFSQKANEFIRSGEESQSDVVKASKAKMRAGIEGADGTLDELGAVGGYLLESPGLATAQAVGSFAGPGLAIKGAGAVAGGLGVGQKAAAGLTGVAREAALAKAASPYSLASGAAVSGAMAGGDAAGQAYDLVAKAPEDVLRQHPAAAAMLDEGLSLEQVRDELGKRAGRDASVIPAMIGTASGMFGAERVFAGLGKGKGGLIGSARTGASEALQEAVEEGATQYEGGRAAAVYDPSIDPTKGVAAAAGMGAALGGITGGALGFFQREQPAKGLIDISRAPTVDAAIEAAGSAVSSPVSVEEVTQNERVAAIKADLTREAMDGIRAQFGDASVPQILQSLAVAGNGALPDAVREPHLRAIEETLFNLKNPPTPESIPVGEATEMIPTGEATQIEQIPVGEATVLPAQRDEIATRFAEQETADAQRKAAEVESIPSLVATQNQTQAAVKRAATLEGPTALAQAIAKLRAPQAEATPIRDQPGPRIVPRTPDMQPTSLAKAQAQAAQTGGEVVAIRNESGKLAYAVKATNGPAQPDLQPTAGVAVGPIPGRGAELVGSSGNLARVPTDAGELGTRSAPTPVAGDSPPAPVRDAGRPIELVAQGENGKAETPATGKAAPYPDGKNIEQTVQIGNEGQTAVIKRDAGKALRSLDERRNSLIELRNCMRKAA